MPQDHGQPLEVSVIVPLFNEEERIEQNLLSLVSQRNAPPYEIIYVDDGSTDGTWTRITELSSHFGNVRTYRLSERRSIGAVRAQAVSLSRGRIIAMLDADCIAPDEWLSHWNLVQGDVGIVGFPVIPPADLEYLHWRFHYRGTGQYEPGSMPHGCGSLVRKDLVLQAGNFADTSLGEDTELFWAIRRLGSRVVLLESPAIRLLQKRTTLRGHLARCFRMGRTASSKFRRIYALILGSLFAFSVAAAVVVTPLPWLSACFVIAGVGLLVNPLRVLRYVRDFSLPRNRVARFLRFAPIKFLETLSILCGYLSSLGQRPEARV